MAGRLRPRFNRTFPIFIGSLRRLCSPAGVAGLIALTVLLAVDPAFESAARADHLMCGQQVEKRAQSVWIDPDLTRTGVTRADVLAAFVPWNQLFLKYHGFAIFQEHHGPQSEADILVTARGSEYTWVQTRCGPPLASSGANHSTVLLGWRDSWRNRQVLSHELGHALGLADHGSSAQQAHGHIGFKLCDFTYLGVMSYCAGPQAWFMDSVLPGITVDGDVVRGYW